MSQPRPEHVKAIAWLNESSSASFYLVKVEAIQIGDSPPAPFLTLITGPSPEAIQAGEKKKELAERYVLRKKFWTGLLEKSRAQTKLHANISPTEKDWLGTSAGLPSGLSLNYVARRHDAQAELYIDQDQDSGVGNIEIFNKLFEAKDEIEGSFGDSLDWQSLEGKRACRIRKTVPVGGWQDEPVWPEVWDSMVDTMVRLEKALRLHLRSL